MMKYLIFEDFAGQAVPFIFPDKVAHSEMREQLPYGQVLSGGFLNFDSDGFRCHGGDGELGIKSRPEEDLSIILNALRTS